MPVLTPETEMSSANIQSFAFSTHAQCYNDPPPGVPSFCDLPFADWLRVSWIVKHSFVRETTQTFKQGFQIIGNCILYGIMNLFEFG